MMTLEKNMHKKMSSFTQSSYKDWSFFKSFKTKGYDIDTITLICNSPFALPKLFLLF